MWFQVWPINSYKTNDKGCIAQPAGRSSAWSTSMIPNQILSNKRQRLHALLTLWQGLQNDDAGQKSYMLVMAAQEKCIARGIADGVPGPWRQPWAAAGDPILHDPQPAGSVDLLPESTQGGWQAGLLMTSKQITDWDDIPSAVIYDLQHCEMGWSLLARSQVLIHPQCGYLLYCHFIHTSLVITAVEFRLSTKRRQVQIHPQMAD